MSVVRPTIARTRSPRSVVRTSLCSWLPTAVVDRHSNAGRFVPSSSRRTQFSSLRYSMTALCSLSLTFIPNALSKKDLRFDGFAATAIVSGP